MPRDYTKPTSAEAFTDACFEFDENPVCWTHYTPPGEMAKLYAEATPEEQAEYDTLAAQYAKERETMENPLWDLVKEIQIKVAHQRDSQRRK